ncbi:MAG: response regulator [Bacteroidetes bacterium]|nr:response regulator [Bacteroidota bacterium]
MYYQNLKQKIRNFFKSFFYIGVGKSLLIWFLAISFIPLASVSFINYLNSYLGLTIIAEKSLITTSQLRIEYIESFFKSKVDYLNIESTQKETIDLLSALKISFDKTVNKGDYQHASDRMSKSEILKAKYSAQSLKEQFKDLYLIDKEGNLLFTLNEEPLLGTNLFNSLPSKSKLKEICKQVLISSEVKFSDLENHKNTYKNISGFIAKSIIDDKGNLIGIIAIRISVDDLNYILRYNADLGDTGESYLVGEDLLFRSSSRFEEDSVIMHKQAKNVKTLKWLNFKTHQNDPQYLALNKLDKEEITTYMNNRGYYVLGIYRDLPFLSKLGVNWVMVEEIKHDEAFEYAKQLSDIAKVSFIITVIIVFFVSIFVTRWFVNPIKKLSAWTKQVAEGELQPKNIKAPKNEVGEMVDTFNSLVVSLTNYANISQSSAYGDYSKAVEIRSEKDVLGNSMHAMIESFKEVVRQANKIAKGDYTSDIRPRSEQDALGISLFEMTRQLRINSKEIKEQDWLKTGINKIDGILSGQENIQQLTDDVINFFIEYLGSQIGLLYIKEDGYLNLSATYAFKKSDKNFKRFEIGEGIVGQVAKDQKLITLCESKEILPSLNLAFGEKTPEHFIVAPVIFEKQTTGVIILGSVNEFTDIQQQFFKMVLDSVAISVDSVQSRVQVELLLKQTQELADELTVQQEELRQTNEELEQQTQALKLSEENLKNQQEELKVTNEELEERTNDLEIQRDNIKSKNEELKRAQEEIEQKAKDLEKASKYKSEFMANMSHELRTPLNSILVLSHLLSENKSKHLNEKEVEFAKTINSSGSDLLELINEILDLSKVESGKLDLHIEEFYFHDLTAFIQRTFGPLTDSKKLKLITQIQDGVPQFIKTDIQRVYQILKNLFSNAIKFTSSGSITLNIYRPEADFKPEKSGLDASNSVAISVIDTGIGIKNDKLDLIFEAFKQADGTTSRKYGGTGLGLTISRSFSEILGGEIMLTSEYGKGTTFTLYLPLVFDENKHQKMMEASELKSNFSTSKKEQPQSQNNIISLKEPSFKDDRSSITAGDKFILVIEDDENFSKVLYDLSHEKGFKCMVALDGESGLHLAEFHQPSAIILDIGLPGIDGYEVMERLKDNTRTRHIPVHFISASDKSMKAMKMGAIGYLTKPVSNNKLDEAFKKIETIISKPIKRVLVVEDDQIMRTSIVKLLGDTNIKIVAVDTAQKAYELLKTEKFDCQILDLGLEDMSGFELLGKIRADKNIVDLPIIIYTGKDLSKEDEKKLNLYADSIILKGARSFERLLSETTLFLHQIESEMPESKRKILQQLHNREEMLKDKTILIVDDDMRNVFALSSLLEEKGLKIIAAKNGMDGLDKLSKTPEIDLVLMDIMMPEMDGYEAMQEIRKDQKYKKLPIIALTAKAMKEDRERCIAAGANDYLAKPVDTEKLLSLLRVWLYNK